MVTVESIKTSKFLDQARSLFQQGKEALDCSTVRKAAAVAVTAGTMLIGTYAVGMIPAFIGFSAVSALVYIKRTNKKSPQIPKDISFEQLVSENFDIHANVDQLSDAEIVCLGEKHYDERNTLLNAMIINELSCSEDDVVFLEYDPKDCCGMNQYLFPLAGVPYLNKRLVIKGWDDRGSEPNDAEFQKALQNIERLKRDSNSIWASPKIDAEIEAASSSIWKYWEQESRFFLKRNRHMCKQIESNRRKGRKIFVIGGRNHFNPCLERRGPYEDQCPKAIRETFDYLKKTKYAVLNIKKPVG